MSNLISCFLGLNNTFFLIFCGISAFFILIIIFLNISLVYVKKNEVKIRERFCKNSKALSSGWHLIIPLVDRIVCSLPNHPLLIETKEPLILSLKNNTKISINYSINYIISDSEKYFYNTNNSCEMVSSIIKFSLLSTFNNANLAKYNELSKTTEDNIRKKLNDFGIKVIEISFDYSIK